MFSSNIVPSTAAVRRYQQIFTILMSLGCVAQGFQSRSLAQPNNKHSRRISAAFVPKQPFMASGDFVDVEFEHSPEDGSEESKSKSKGKPNKTNKKTSATEKTKASTSTTEPSEEKEMSLFDLALDSDPKWKEARIPFVDHTQQRVIDGKLAFMVEVEGISYGIAVPFDYPAAVTAEDTDGSVTNMSPDDDDNEELMQIFATQLHEQIGEDLALKRTPKVLTIEGDLDNYTKNWQEEILPPPVDTKQLLDDSDEDLEFFHDFMKRELGMEEYERTMAEPATQDSIPDEIMELFDIPGLGERENDTAGMEEMLESLFEDDPFEAMNEQLGAKKLEHDGVALKLISYRFKDGKSYSLVKLMKPFPLVGKYVEEPEGGIRFELMSPEEEAIVIPKLEQICQKDLEDAGLNLAL
jgi:hypothetical protein